MSVTELKWELNAPDRQQEALNKLSREALSGLSLLTLFSQVTRDVAQALDISCCRLLAWSPGTGWVLKASHGWPGVAQDESLPTGYGGLAGLACSTLQVVVMNDRMTEKRFETGDDYQALRCGAAVAIPGRHCRFGVLEIGADEYRVFRPDELNFLQSLANLLGIVIDRNTLETQADLKARESEIRFQTLADAVPVLIGVIDSEGNAVYYNRACQEFAQESSEDLVKNSWMRVVHPDDRQKLIDVYTTAIPQRRQFALEYRAVRHDGVACYLMNIGAPRFQADGQFLGYVMLAIDMTEERKSSARVQRIMDANLVGILYTRLDGQILDCNDAFLEMVGYSRSDLAAGMDFWSLTPPEYMELSAQVIKRLRETGICEPFEKQYIRKDGSRIDLLVATAGLTDEEPDTSVTLVIDISKQKQAQRAMEKNLERERLNREILEIVSRSDRVETVMDEAVRTIGRQFQADRVMVIYYPPEAQSLGVNMEISHQYLSSPDIPLFKFSDFKPDLEHDLNQFVPEYLKTIKRPVTSPEEFLEIVECSFRFNHVPEEKIGPLMEAFREVWIDRYRVRSYVRMDIQYLGRRYGSLNLQHCATENMWTESDLEVLSDAVHYLGAAFYQMELHWHEQQVMRELEKSYNLIHIVSQAQNHFISCNDNEGLFRDLVNRLLDYTDSEYGFIGKIQHDAEGNPYLKTLFLTDISWSEETHRLYEETQAAGMEFRNLHTLFGEVMTTGKPVFSNDPGNDPRRGGLPHGHPPLNAFLGLPLYKGEEMVGMLGISNRPGGYDEALAEALQPYVVACANIIVGVRSETLREHLTQELSLSERALKNYASRLELSNNELEQFATVASHDLQAPLRKVILFSEYLRSSLGENLNDESRDYMERIQKATRKMQSLITDLLALSRVNRKGKPFVPVDLREVAEDVVSDLEETIQETGGQVIIGEMMAIDADGIQIQQVLQNLIGNALKFHRPDLPPLVEISAVPVSNQFCQIRVKDNGIGFDEKYLDRVFTLFERLHGEQEYPGTGMGLAIVKKIVERHHGEVTAQSQPGDGATFIVTLPIHQA